MHRKNDDLFNLIASLSSEEKRYTRRFLGTQSAQDTQPFYLQVFEGLLSGKSEVSSVHNTSPQALVTARRHLYANILKALRVMHQDGSVDRQILNLLADVEILYQRNLPEQGVLSLNKAHRLALKNEKFGLLLQILHWERKLNIILDQPTRTVNEISQEEFAVLAKLSQVREMEAIFSKAKAIKRQYGYVKGMVRAQLAQQTILATGMPTADGCLSYQAMHYYNFIHALYHWMMLEHKKAFDYSKRLLTPGLQVVLPNDYLDGILEHVTSCICLGYFEDALRQQQLAAAYVAEQKHLETQHIQYLLFCYDPGYKLLIYNYMGQTDLLAQTIETVLVGMEHYAAVISPEGRYVSGANLMYAYLGLGAMDKVNQLLQQLLQKKSKNVRLHFYDSLYFFRLFFLLQCRSYEIIPAMASAAYRHYRKVNDATGRVEVELPVVRMLSKDYDLADKKVRASMLLEIRQILEDYVRKITDGYNFQEHYSFYILWCTSLIEDRPYAAVAKSWYESFRKQRKYSKVEQD